MIGFLMLIGIVVTNAIVLLDLVERLKSQGHSTRDALIEGGRTRVRPILMTAFATILALIPLAAGFNEGSIIAAELGTVVIGGLFSSTFLTLLVVPVVYSLVDGGKRTIGRRFGRPEEPRYTRPADEADVPPRRPGGDGPAGADEEPRPRADDQPPAVVRAATAGAPVYAGGEQAARGDRRLRRGGAPDRVGDGPPPVARGLVALIVGAIAGFLAGLLGRRRARR
jgi:hypothetical protein